MSVYVAVVSPFCTRKLLKQLVEVAKQRGEITVKTTFTSPLNNITECIPLLLKKTVNQIGFADLRKVSVQAATTLPFFHTTHSLHVDVRINLLLQRLHEAHEQSRRTLDLLLPLVRGLLLRHRLHLLPRHLLRIQRHRAQLRLSLLSVSRMCLPVFAAAGASARVSGPVSLS